MGTLTFHKSERSAPGDRSMGTALVRRGDEETGRASASFVSATLKRTDGHDLCGRKEEERKRESERARNGAMCGASGRRSDARSDLVFFG